jgi:nitrite reductase/ring-hydroxylating ferredoxin subunit
MDNCSAIKSASCNSNVTKIEGGINRRALLTGIAGVLGAVGLASTGEAAMAAAKTYTIGKTTDIQVKGGKMYNIGGTPVLVTQPKAGVFRAFNGYCTHQQTPLGGINGSNVVCYQHGASYDSTTGAVTGPPATRPLTKITLTISGTTMKVKL